MSAARGWPDVGGGRLGVGVESCWRMEVGGECGTRLAGLWRRELLDVGGGSG